MKKIDNVLLDWAMFLPDVRFYLLKEKVAVNIIIAITEGTLYNQFIVVTNPNTPEVDVIVLRDYLTFENRNIPKLIEDGKIPQIVPSQSSAEEMKSKVEGIIKNTNSELMKYKLKNLNLLIEEIKKGDIRYHEIYDTDA